MVEKLRKIKDFNILQAICRYQALDSSTQVSVCVDRVIEMHFPEFCCTLGVKNVAILSDEAAKN